MDKVISFYFRRESKQIFVWLRGCQPRNVQLLFMRGKELFVAMSEQVLNISILIWRTTCIYLSMLRYSTLQVSLLFLLLRALRELHNMLMKLKKSLRLIFLPSTFANIISNNFLNSSHMQILFLEMKMKPLLLEKQLV